MQKSPQIVNQILNGDCIKVLETIPEKSIDLIFADPPYNLQIDKQLWRPNFTRVNGVEETWDQFNNFESYDEFTHDWLSGCRTVLKDTGTIWVIGTYHNIFRVGRILQDLGFWVLNDVVWVKNNPMPNFHGVRFTNAHETLIWAQKIKGNRYTFNYQMMKSLNTDKNENGGIQMRSDWRLPLCTGKERLKNNGVKAHPTQKPEALLERVIISSSNPGDLILDPFFGSGTTGAVAKRLGRNWIGIEADVNYVHLAQKRIDGIRMDTASMIMPVKKNGKVKRIPFSAIVDAGYLQLGQILYFNGKTDKQAIVFTQGKIEYKGQIGSIHKIGSDILKTPCNGWLTWYYLNQKSGQYERIDVLRQKVRMDIALGDKTKKS